MTILFSGVSSSPCRVASHGYAWASGFDITLGTLKYYFFFFLIIILAMFNA